MILVFRVTPNAKKTELTSWDGVQVGLRLHAPALENKANEALVAFCADFFQLPKTSVQLVRGHQNRTKQIHLPLPILFVHEKLTQAVRPRRQLPTDGNG